MGGFAALLGGIGAGAQAYGQQVRGLLENRREHMMGLLMQQASIERNPEHRANILKAVSDMAAGKKPVDQILPPLYNSWQKSAQQDLQVAQAAGYQPPQGPVNVPGQSLGQVGQGVPQAGTAAEPGISPVAPQGSAQAGPLPAAMGAPSIADQGIAPLVAPQASASAPVPSTPPSQTAAGGPFAMPIMPSAPAYNPVAGMQQAYKFLMRPDVTPAMAGDLGAFISNQAEMARQLGVSQAFIQQKMQFLPGYMQRLAQIYQDAPPLMKPLLQSHGMEVQGWVANPDPSARFPTLPFTMGNLTRNFQHHDDALSLEAQYPGILRKYNIDPTRTPQVIVTRNQLDPGGEPINVEAIYPGTVGVTGVGGEVGRALNVPGNLQAPGGPAISSAMQPVTTEVFKDINGYNDQGQPVTNTYRFTKSTYRGRFSPQAQGPERQAAAPSSTLPNGRPAPPEEIPQGGQLISSVPRSLTPEETINESKKLQTYHVALDRFEAVRAKLPLLNSMLEAGKIQFFMDDSGFHAGPGAGWITKAAAALSPMAKGVLGRNVLSDDEANLIADFRAIGEDVNMVRGPLGAQSFRGPEAWNRLQQQAGTGELMRDPRITMRVLDNTITVLKAQMAPLDRNSQLRLLNRGLFERPQPITPAGTSQRSLESFQH